MFKGQPKGLIAAALANMGERFGFYIMMAILALFLSSKFGLAETPATIIYSVFYALIYVLALVGGYIADRTKNYKGTIAAGLFMMAIGYGLIAIPTPTPVPNLGLYLALTCVGLFVIAFGNGLFKGNLQALVGQMYDNPEYASKRDSGFQIFYMFINIGAMFAPLIAIALRNWWLASNGLQYDATLPALCHSQIAGTITPEQTATFAELASAMDPAADLTAFAHNYLNVFNLGFQYAFAASVVAMLISIVIFFVNRKRLPDPAAKKAVKAEEKVGKQQVEMSATEIRQRIFALMAVFAVVIFFWFSFHQNGVTLTFFARDYTDLSVLSFDLGFTKIEGAEIFSSFNPIFVVLLTPVVIALFSALQKRGMEPSTPKKIGIGMGIAALAFVVLAAGSFSLPSMDEVKAMGALPAAQRVTPFLLVGTYFILTVAELFISPLGLSFVSKVAPPHLQGIMQGCWLAATALGNQLLFIGTILYTNIPIWATWTVFVGACLISMLAMLGMVKWLERVAK